MTIRLHDRPETFYRPSSIPRPLPWWREPGVASAVVVAYMMGVCCGALAIVLLVYATLP